MSEAVRPPNGTSFAVQHCMNSSHHAVILPFLFAFTACSAGATAPDHRDDDPPEAEPPHEETPDDDLGGLGGPGTGHGAIGTNVSWPEHVACPAVEQRVLIFDFRSGWWDDFYADWAEAPDPSTPPPAIFETLAGTCDNIEIEYHHIYANFEHLRCTVTSAEDIACEETFYDATGGLAPTLEQASLDDYTQLWVLSGSDADGGATQSGQLFADFLSATKGSCLPVFIGAGAGNHLHGNIVAAELGLGSVFATTTEEAYDVPWTVDVTSFATVSDHVLFEGVDEIADTVEAVYEDPFDPAYDWSVTLATDALSLSGTKLDIAATSQNGEGALAVGAIALPEDGARPFVLDGGLQRYYAIEQHAGTRTLLANVVQVLGNVGCKADLPK